MDWYLEEMKKRKPVFVERRVERDLQREPYERWVTRSRFERHLELMEEHQDMLRGYQRSRNIRRMKFRCWQSQQSFFDSVVQAFKPSSPDKTTLIIFGNAGSDGSFVKRKGAGFKGPVVAMKRALAKHYVVVSADEFRTSSYCLHCGLRVRHPKTTIEYEYEDGVKESRREEEDIIGVSFCGQKSHRVGSLPSVSSSSSSFSSSSSSSTAPVKLPSPQIFLDRDLDAAEKIAYRSLAVMMDLKLGVFDRSKRDENILKVRGLSQLQPKKDKHGNKKYRIPQWKGRLQPSAPGQCHDQPQPTVTTTTNTKKKKAGTTTSTEMRFDVGFSTWTYDGNEMIDVPRILNDIRVAATTSA